jgi:Spy/CpxP family protein refolding chaperone
MKITVNKITGLMARLSVALLFLLCFFIPVFAQATNLQQNENSNRQQQDAPQPRKNLMEELGLTQDQIRQLRAINQQTKEQNLMANRRVQFALRVLDEAIYADVVDEALIEQRAKELAAAQAEQIKLRVMRELQIRRVLTPEQLQKFLIIRQSMMRQERLRQQQLNRDNQNRPLRNNQQPIMKPRQNPNNFPIRNKIRQNQLPTVPPGNKQPTKPL